MEELEYRNNGDDAEGLRKMLEGWRSEGREGSAINNLPPSQLSLLRQVVSMPSNWEKLQVFLQAEFMDQEEALDHVAAYWEAAELGMDTNWNISYIAALAATNRRIGHSSRVSNVLDAVSHFRYTSNMPKEYKQPSGGPEKNMNG